MADKYQILNELKSMLASKHSQLIGWFNKNFISTAKLESKYGKVIRKAYEYR